MLFETQTTIMIVGHSIEIPVFSFSYHSVLFYNELILFLLIAVVALVCVSCSSEAFAQNRYPNTAKCHGTTGTLFPHLVTKCSAPVKLVYFGYFSNTVTEEYLL